MRPPQSTCRVCNYRCNGWDLNRKRKLGVSKKVVSVGGHLNNWVARAPVAIINFAFLCGASLLNPI